MRPSSWNFAKPGPRNGTSTSSQHSDYIERHSIHACQARPPPSACYSFVIAVHKWVLLHQAPTTRARRFTQSHSDQSEAPAKYKMFASTCNITMSNDDFDESTRVLELDAPPLKTRAKQGDLVLVSWFRVPHRRCPRETDP